MDPNVILKIAEHYEPQWVEMRREFHRYPERSGQEYHTTERIKHYLHEMGCEILPLKLETGLVARIAGSRPGPTRALRVDIDALPLDEHTDLPFQSEQAGLMHACGHDSHITWGLGAAQILHDLQEDLAGDVLIIFQPDEERTAGARAILETGALHDVSMIFGAHNKPDLPAGTVALSPGYLMASSGNFDFELHGKGGHGAIPHLTIDPIPAVGAILSGIQSIVARNINPLDSAVVSVGCVEAGTVGNIIPSTARVQGTVRAYKESAREVLMQRLSHLVNYASQAYGCTVTWRRLQWSVPPVNNDPRATAWAEQQARLLLGDRNVLEAIPVLASEDFSIYQERIPGCFFWIGSQDPDAPGGPGWHHPAFSVDERCLKVGSAVLAAIAFDPPPTE